jgi:hypothetical protein
VDSVRSTAGSKIGKYHCRIPGKESYARSDRAPPRRARQDSSLRSRLRRPVEH